MNFCLLLVLFSFYGNNNARVLSTADDILKKTSTVLNKSGSIQYGYTRDYFTGDNHYYLNANVFIDLTSPDTLVHLKYHITAEGIEFFFNGTESFVLDKRSSTIDVINKPTKENLQGESYFSNSLVALRGTLPLLITDRSIKKELRDTIIKNTVYHLVCFSLHKKLLGNFGGYFPITEDRTFHFKLVINKATSWPYLLYQTNSTDEHSNTTTFTNIKTEATGPQEESWYYSSYLNEYAIAGKKMEVPLLAVGIEAPAFELPLFNSDKTVSSLQYKGKVTLLEFWIRNCGPCISSVPTLNALQEKYKSRGLEILAVNPHDAIPAINYFFNTYKPLYSIAYNGEKLSKQFGVAGYPVVFILNKKGEIIYSGSADENAIAGMIEKAL